MLNSVLIFVTLRLCLVIAMEMEVMCMESSSEIVARHGCKKLVSSVERSRMMVCVWAISTAGLEKKRFDISCC